MVNSTHRPQAQLRCGQQQHNRGQQDIETPQYALVYFTSGSGRYHTAKETLTFHAGCIVQRFPNLRHQLYFDTPCNSLFVAIPATGLELLRSFDHAHMPSTVFDIGIDQQITKRFQQLHQDLRTRIPQQHIHIASHALQLIIDIHQRAFAINNHQSQQDFIHHACSILQSDLHLHIDLPDLAQNIQMSYASFRKRFTQAMGISPGQFRIQQRIEKAKHYVLQGIAIAKIADMLGYADCYCFSKQFKKHSGFSPRKFRSNQGLG